jgi:hypothetical protein
LLRVCEGLLESVWNTLLHADSSHPQACSFLPLQAKAEDVQLSKSEAEEMNLDNL